MSLIVFILCVCVDDFFSYVRKYNFHINHIYLLKLKYKPKNIKYIYNVKEYCYQSSYYISLELKCKTKYF